MKSRMMKNWTMKSWMMTTEVTEAKPGAVHEDEYDLVEEHLNLSYFDGAGSFILICKPIPLNKVTGTKITDGWMLKCETEKSDDEVG